MKHYGDICKIDGHSVPIVDVICGGSPCQDLSVAGRREGLQGSRSGLFMEQIRVTKEMREHDKESRRNSGSDEHIRPRYMVWENVDGARSSGKHADGSTFKGEDFRIVLEEICKIADENATIPRPPKDRWEQCGCIVGDGAEGTYSVAWLIHDAQYHGVPQRRKRICVLADFSGDTAPKILFELLRETELTDTVSVEWDNRVGYRPKVLVESESVSGNPPQSECKGQGTPRDITDSIRETISFQERAGCDGGGKGILIQNERVCSLRTENNQAVAHRKPLFPLDEKMGQTYIHEEQGNTLAARDFKQPQCIAYEVGGGENRTSQVRRPFF